MTPGNPADFFAHVRAVLFGGVLTEPQVEGINAILAQLPDGTDARWLAYELATAYHETGRTMQPVRENGGHPYGHPPAKYWLPAGPYGQIYYGRGLPQTTWLANYEKADERMHALGVLKPEESLVRTPDLMLRMDVAAATMVDAMTLGWFTGKKLADYFNANSTDWLGARRIINGLDCAAQIAGYAIHFRRALALPAPPHPLVSEASDAKIGGLSAGRERNA